MVYHIILLFPLICLFKTFTVSGPSTAMTTGTTYFCIKYLVFYLLFWRMCFMRTETLTMEKKYASYTVYILSIMFSSKFTLKLEMLPPGFDFWHTVQNYLTLIGWEEYNLNVWQQQFTDQALCLCARSLFHF